MKFNRNHLHLGQTFCTWCETHSSLSLPCTDLDIVGLWNQMFWGNINKVESLWKIIQYWANETHQSSYILPKIYLSGEETNQDMTSWGRSFEIQTHPFSNLETAEVELTSLLFSKSGGAASCCITAKLFASFSPLCVRFSFPIICQGNLAPTSCIIPCMICTQLVLYFWMSQATWITLLCTLLQFYTLHKVMHLISSFLNVYLQVLSVIALSLHCLAWSVIPEGTTCSLAKVTAGEESSVGNYQSPRNCCHMQSSERKVRAGVGQFPLSPSLFHRADVFQLLHILQRF